MQQDRGDRAAGTSSFVPTVRPGKFISCSSPKAVAVPLLSGVPEV